MEGSYSKISRYTVTDPMSRSVGGLEPSGQGITSTKITLPSFVIGPVQAKANIFIDFTSDTRRKLFNSVT